ncbi:hypothetical protein ACF090_31945 [Streptomyces sp. NPDC014892]|uniref:hypothetical protein n=1 Tax=Streptomyces sp. NPDC014892 TaxID=3364930 RepID=UPI0037027E3C
MTHALPGRLGPLLGAAFACALLTTQPTPAATATGSGSGSGGTTHSTTHTIVNDAGGLPCGGRFGEGCGTGVVTHADGSLSVDGRPTGGGMAPGYPRP